MEDFLIIGIMIASVPIVVIIFRYHENKRTEALKAVANSLDLSFSKKGNKSLLSSQGQFQLFSLHSWRKVSNVMSGSINEIDVTIMDYRYQYGRHKRYQTVILFQSTLLRLPSFVLQPEGLLHKIVSIIGYQDINFDSHPTFSKQYLLHGADEEAIRNIFTDKLLTFYAQRKGFSTECKGDKFIFYKDELEVSPQEIQTFLEEGAEAFRLAMKGCG